MTSLQVILANFHFVAAVTAAAPIVLPLTLFNVIQNR